MSRSYADTLAQFAKTYADKGVTFIGVCTNDDLTVEQLRLVEESCDRHSDPSLTFLRRIATVLNTTVADLVQPDLGETFSSFS